MITRRFWLFALAILFSQSGAVAEDNVMTGRYLNGNAWMLLDVRPKMIYVTAFQEGYGMALLNWVATAKGNPTVEELKNQENHYMTDGAFTTVDIIQQLDTFYTDRQNLSMPVPYAYLYVVKKFRGATAKDLNDFKNRVKRNLNTLESK